MDRRNFLSTGLKVGLGVAAGLTVGSEVALANRSENLPYPYVKLDPERVAK